MQWLFTSVFQLLIFKQTVISALEFGSKTSLPRPPSPATSMNLQGTVIITGASSGIGKASARALASSGFEKIVLVARRIDRLESLKADLHREFKDDLAVHAVQLDVTDLDAVARLPSDLPVEFQDVTLLLNNAGLAAGFGPVANFDMQDMEVMVDTNIKGLGACCRAFLPGMLARKRGHIINISSIAGKASYPGGAFYCASKFAVEAITAALRAEVVSTPIRVTTVSPGWVNEGTEFSKVRFKDDMQRVKSLYEGVQALSADDVADAIVYAATRPHHVQVADIYLLPTCQSHPFEGGLHRDTSSPAQPPPSRL